MTMKDVSSREWEGFQGRQLTLGGIVTGYREGMTKNGKPYGIIRIEDLSGSGDIALFGDDYINFSKYGRPGLYLFVNATVQPRRWKDSELDLRISAIRLLQDVKDSLVHSIRITVPIDALNEQIISELSAIVKSNPGKTQLAFYVLGRDHVALNLYSHDTRLCVTEELIDFIRESGNMDFTINQS